MECSGEIFSLLENFEKKLSNKINNEGKKESSSYLIKLCLNYSLNHLLKKKNLIEKIIQKKKIKIIRMK